ncbi:D-alanyl-D-alanine carboxypeptidase [Paenibacillus polymyxa]|uniref:D-alanyl-D-alanine carboxypeptidase n=1 Tax=Paenibacillus polymyxa TaxID=1406 RepID=A0ABX2ZJK2_PAEPO|nr:D-alanyl-D-alanine carboxypeptidase [Paenibacillus polymyxa]
MNAACTKQLKSGKIKLVSGTVLQHGQGIVTLAVTDHNGNRSIKRIRESEYNIRFF